MVTSVAGKGIESPKNFILWPDLFRKGLCLSVDEKDDGMGWEQCIGCHFVEHCIAVGQLRLLVGVIASRDNTTKRLEVWLSDSVLNSTCTGLYLNYRYLLFKISLYLIRWFGYLDCKLRVVSMDKCIYV